MTISTKYRLPIRIALVGLLITSVSGCSYFKGFLTKIGVAEDESVATTKLPVSTVSSGKIYFKNPTARYDGNMIVVRGTVANRYAVNIQGGHVDAKLYGPDDIQIAEVSTFQSPRTIKTRARKHVGYMGSKFLINIQKKPTEGSRVVLWFHRKDANHVAMAPH
jgi:hypothetical protein